jgi:hypothetical protein
MAWCSVKAQGQLYIYLYLHCTRLQIEFYGSEMENGTQHKAAEQSAVSVIRIVNGIFQSQPSK